MPYCGILIKKQQNRQKLGAPPPDPLTADTQKVKYQIFKRSII